MALEVGATCARMASDSKTGLPAELVYFTDSQIQYPTYFETYYGLRPEIVESLWYLYTYTSNDKYRNKAGEIWAQIEDFAKTESAYTEIENVDVESPVRRDKM
jgi:hypothetical protein